MKLNLKRSQLQRYSIALLTTVVALLLTQQLWWQIQPVIYPFFLSAVAISSWYGGIGPGLLVIALSALEECGAEVTVVGSVDEAITLLEHSKLDVLVSDIGMPDKDGYVLIRHVKQIEAETGVKIGAVSEAMPKAIALTAYAREEDRAQALQAGFQLYLTKPVDPNELIAAIASLVQSSERL